MLGFLEIEGGLWKQIHELHFTKLLCKFMRLTKETLLEWLLP